MLSSNLVEELEIQNKIDEKKDSRLFFEGLEFEAKKGEITMVIGKNGSGKSSLLYAILGEMRVKQTASSRIWINTRLAYCGQTPWLINGTLKDNVVMNLEYDEEKLNSALVHSALNEDVKQWSEGAD